MCYDSIHNSLKESLKNIKSGFHSSKSKTLQDLLFSYGIRLPLPPEIIRVKLPVNLSEQHCSLSLSLTDMCSSSHTENNSETNDEVQINLRYWMKNTWQLK